MILDQLGPRVLEALDTPCSLSCFLLLKYGEHTQLAGKRVKPDDYLTPWDFAKDYQACELLRKLPALKVDADLEGEARGAFLAAERTCYLTNCRMTPLLEGSFEGVPRFLPSILDRIKRYVRFILGGVPDGLSGRHGPGSTFSDMGGLNSLFHKMSSTPAYCGYKPAVFHAFELSAWGRGFLRDSRGLSQPTRVRGCRFTTVPKDSTKLRGIAIEPSMNVFSQLGVGRHIRTRLKKRGNIDLELGQDVNKRAARYGSTHGHLATIDLSSASDTVSRLVVKLFLPGEWYDLLDSLRSPMTKVDGSWHRLEKFSSMGNGFTFELETLIFSAICYGAGVKDPLVYGDDIIVPRRSAGRVLSLLKFFGFTPNPRKTFVTGPFRESCGGDYFLGCDVTPIRLTSEEVDVGDQLVVANQVRRILSRFGLDEGLCSIIEDQIPLRFRLYGPESLGDLVLHGERERWSLRVKDSRLFIRVVIPQPSYHEFTYRDCPSGAGLACALYGVPSRGLPKRGTPSGYKVDWISYAQS